MTEIATSFELSEGGFVASASGTFEFGGATLILSVSGVSEPVSDSMAQGAIFELCTKLDEDAKKFMASREENS